MVGEHPKSTFEVRIESGDGIVIGKLDLRTGKPGRLIQQFPFRPAAAATKRGEQ